MDGSPPGSSVLGDSSGENGLPTFLQGVFLIQESNPGLPHCQRVLYCLNHQGTSRLLKKMIPVILASFLVAFMEQKFSEILTSTFLLTSV